MREDWEIEELGKLFHTTSGGTPSRKNKEFYEGEIHWVKSGELDKGIIYDTEEKISEEAVKNSSAKLFPEGTLLIALYGATIGKLAFLGVGATTNQAICGIFKNEFVDSNYLYNFLRFRRPKLISQGTGGAQPNISQTILKRLKLPFPSKPEQRAIVHKIENLFTSLDKGIADLKKAQEQLKVYRQAVLKKAFEGELTKEWREKHAKTDGRPSQEAATTTIAAEPTTTYKKQGAEKLPEGWKLVRLGEVCNSVEYGTSTKSSDVGKVPVLRMGNIQNGRIDWSDLKYTDDNSEIEKYRLKHNDVLFNRTNSAEHVGKTAIYKGEKEAIFAGYLIRINYKSEVVAPDFLNYYLNSHEAKQYGNQVKSFGVNQSNINGTKLKKYPLPLPELNEQHQIVREIESRLSVCDKVEQNITEGLEKSEALRQSILKKAFEGKLLNEAEIEKCKQAADYEPAQKLLERIKNDNPGKRQSQ
jgi:type I restriction enzyme, S subunit